MYEFVLNYFLGWIVDKEFNFCLTILMDN